MYIDTHAHFDLCIEEGIKEEDLIKGLKDNNISHCVQVSIDLSGLEWSLNFARRYRKIGAFFTMGIHPSSNANRDKLANLSDYVDKIMQSDDSDLLFGIGETGLDYYRMRQPMQAQTLSFEQQIDIAKKWKLPVIVHSRDSMEDTLGILRNAKVDKGIMHCFSGNSDDARIFLDMGFYISFAGNLTYSKALKLHDAAAYVPLDRLLLETDAPFLTPVPHRGKKNYPHYVKHTYAYIAELKNTDPDLINEKIKENFYILANR